MRYFKRIAEQAFITSTTGERLFCWGGPWSRPFIIPDADTEQRLFKKLVWMQWLSAFGLPIFMVYLAGPLADGLGGFRRWDGYFIGGIVWITVKWVIERIMFARDLRFLQRAPDRSEVRFYYRQMRLQRSRADLLMGCIVCLLAMGVFILMGMGGLHLVITIIFAGLCGWGAFTLGYAIFLKSKTDIHGDEKRSA